MMRYVKRNEIGKPISPSWNVME